MYGIPELKWPNREVRICPSLQVIIKGNRFFAAMQAVTGTEVEKFLKYIHARPEKYAGNSWKFCEIMATWMMAGAPAAGE